MRSTVLMMYLQVYQNKQRSTQTKETHVLSHFCAQRVLFCTIRTIVDFKYDAKASVVPVASRNSPFFPSLPLCLKMWVKFRKSWPDIFSPAHPGVIIIQSTFDDKLKEKRRGNESKF